jgi:hypothetical protein
VFALPPPRDIRQIAIRRLIRLAIPSSSNDQLRFAGYRATTKFGKPGASLKETARTPDVLAKPMNFPAKLAFTFEVSR